MRTYICRNKTDTAIEHNTLDQPASLNSVPEHYEDLCGEFPLILDDSNSDFNPNSSTDDLDIPIAIRKGVRTCTKHPISNFISYDSLSPSNRTFVLSVSSVSISQGWKEAYVDPKWKAVMVEEMRALAKNEIWDLVTLSLGKRPVGCKWVFTVKHRTDGSIERYKIRLVAKGFT